MRKLQTNCVVSTLLSPHPLILALNFISFGALITEPIESSTEHYIELEVSIDCLFYFLKLTGLQNFFKKSCDFMHMKVTFSYLELF